MRSKKFNFSFLLVLSLKGQGTKNGRTGRPRGAMEQMKSLLLQPIGLKIQLYTTGKLMQHRAPKSARSWAKYDRGGEESGDQGVLGPTYVLSFGNPMHFFLSSDRASQCDNNTYVLHCINFPVVCNWIFKPIGCSSSDFICKKTIGICVKTSGVVIIFYCFFQAGASGEPQFIWCSFKNVKFDWLRKDTKSTMSCQSTLHSRFYNTWMA